MKPSDRDRDVVDTNVSESYVRRLQAKYPERRMHPKLPST